MEKKELCKQPRFTYYGSPEMWNKIENNRKKNLMEMKMNKEMKKEMDKFILEYGNPITTDIPNWFRRLFLPKEYYLVRESIYAELKLKEKRTFWR